MPRPVPGARLLLLGLLGPGCGPAPAPGAPTAPAGAGLPTADTGPAADSAAPRAVLPVPDTPGWVHTDPAPAAPCADPEARARLGPGAWVDDPTGPAALGDFAGELPGSTMSMAVGDIDGDGVFDLVYGRPDGVRLYHGTGDGRFAPMAPGAWPGLEPADQLLSGVILVDLDDDGDLDVVATHRTRLPRRYENDGHGHFTAHDDLDPSPAPLAHVGSAVGDLDGDGQLDLFVGGNQPARFDPADPVPAEPAAVFDLAGGVLRPHSVALPAAAHPGYTFVTGLVDLDEDGLLDALLINDHGAFGGPNQLLWNRSRPGTLDFAVDDGSHGLTLTMLGMGLGVGDLNDDGRPDLAISNRGTPKLLLSTPDGAWYDTAWASGVRDSDRSSVGWGTAFGDLDNDGDLDLSMVFGMLPGVGDEHFPNDPEQPDKLFLNDGTGQFTDVAAAWGLDDRSVGRSSVLADLNGDGFLDVVLAPQFAPPRVWLARCDTQAWLAVALVQPPPNIDAVGAKVQVVAGDRVWTRWVAAGGRSFGASPPLVLHFGLGMRDRVDRVLVTWPDGAVTEATDLATRQRIELGRD